MAYFLPSYFQKRLLRYALTRLDFIETDALNLEDLGVTFGQRSVIDLKNVGIKVKRLIDILHLPSTLTLDHALIRSLRITVPADLHVSGIVVEIDGVDIQVEIQEEDEKHKSQSKSSPSHRDVANRPRLSSTLPHDPGGQHVIPTSRDLAKSFLETEPRSEREELEAAIQSQSRLQESTVSLASTTEDAGLGMPGGFSLPGFVANFFAGVADRLSVSIKNVQVVVGLHIPSDTSRLEIVRVMVRVAELSLGSLLTSTDEGSNFQKRKITCSELELLLLSEAESFSQHSTSSSPRLLRSRSKASSVFGSEDLGQPESPEDHLPDSEASTKATLPVRSAVPELPIESSQSTSHPFPDVPNSPKYDTFLEDSQLFDSSYINSPSHSGIKSQPGSAHGERNSRLSDISSSAALERTLQPPLDDRRHSDDLTESKMFTHEEAESLYMSAVSENFGSRLMPGGWNTQEDGSGQDQREVESRQTHLPEQTESDHTSARTAPQLQERIKNVESGRRESKTQGSGISGYAQFDADRYRQGFSKLVAKRLVHMQHFIVQIPATSDTTVDEQTFSVAGTSTRLEDSVLAVPLSQSSSRIDTTFNRPQPHTSQYRLDIGEVLISLDLSIGRILVKAMSFAKKILPTSKLETKTAESSAGSLHAASSIQLLTFNICQSVPESYLSTVPAQTNLSRQDASSDDLTLLKLSMARVGYEMRQTMSVIQQKVTIEKITMYKGNETVLYFVDSINVRDSVATSVMLKHHDLVINNKDDRFEIQMKPVHAVIDLLLVDDVLSRGGGLSSLLDLGNSIMSTGTIKDSSTRRTPALPRQRSIRFDQSASRSEPESESVASGPKIDIRISGIFVDLIGSETSIQLRTSAIKLVSRHKIFRAQIDNAALLGPLPIGSKRSADISVKLVNLSLIYMDAPAEEDLDRLLSLLTPSSDRYDEEDDIMVDTLIRQRRKGGVLRVALADVQTTIRGIEWQKHVARLGDELSKLSAVSKYLPEDDRPGVLTFGLINKLGIKADLGSKFGILQLHATLLEGAQISVPSLMAAQMSTLSLQRGQDILLSEVIPNLQATTVMGPPMLMCRFIADEMEPTVRIKLSNTQVEYTVPTLMAIMDLLDSLKATNPPKAPTLSPRSSEISSSSSDMSDFARKVRFSLAVRNAALALNPDKNPAKGLLLLSDAGLSYSSKHDTATAQLDIRKASILIIDDADKIGHGLENADHKLYFEENDQVQDLTKAGYVPVGSISNASAVLKLNQDKTSNDSAVDIELRNNLFLLETCADSTQTLIQIFSGLAPPSIPSPQVKYRTEVIPIQDMLASFTGNAFVTEPGPEMGLQASQLTATSSTSRGTRHRQRGKRRISDGEDEEDDDYDDYDEDEDADEDADEAHDSDSDDQDTDDLHAREYPRSQQDDLTDSYMDSELSHSVMSDSVHVAPVNLTADDPTMMEDSVMAHSMLDFRTDHFARKSSVGGTAHRWDSARNTYGLDDDNDLRQSPLKVRIRDVHVIWNLFDGYDWQGTRDTISQAVQKIETQAMVRQSKRDSKRSPGVEDDQSVIGDFLFNSIYIGIPASKDPRELAGAINQDIGDLVSETGSYATSTTVTAIQSGRSAPARPRQKKLRLNRSRQHKMTFELKGVSADLLAFPPGSGEVETSIDIRVKQLEIFDHVPTSTWKKFATYMHEAGEREIDTSMVHIELLVVKPVADLAASEMVLKLTVLPLRLHIDQDALDFMTRFFEFKDDKVVPSSSPSAPPFFQRVEVNPIQLKLDFKPKRVDYGGLRSGRTTEFMNFFVLDRADMVLRRVILYGVSGLDRVGIMLNNIWSPDVKRNQLPGVLAGLAPIRSLVDVGSGVKDLVAVPIREYKKDGRIVRSIQKGAVAFAKTTTTELVNLGAKLAIGTQTVLQNAEEMLVPRQRDDDDEEVREQISLYADQPIGIVQGLRGAYASLERDLLLARDAIVAVPGEIMASGSATGAAKAVLRQSPTIILRPAIGATKAVGQTLLGAGNTLDKGNLRRIEQKYKRPF